MSRGGAARGSSARRLRARRLRAVAALVLVAAAVAACSSDPASVGTGERAAESPAGPASLPAPPAATPPAAAAPPPAATPPPPVEPPLPVEPPPPAPLPTAPETPPPEAPPPEAPPPRALTHWFAGGIAGKKICFIGDSTTKNALALFAELEGKYSANGEPLHGAGPILNFGENGASLYAFMTDQVVHGLTATIAEQADLYVLSYGINDVRLGYTTEDALVARLTSTVNRIRAEAPNADLVLRTPNSLLATDVNAYGYVQPNTNAQAYTTMLRSAYRRLEDAWPNVVVFDAQALVFGTESLPASLLMSDQLHPSPTGNTFLASALVEVIGEPPSP